MCAFALPMHVFLFYFYVFLFFSFFIPFEYIAIAEGRAFIQGDPLKGYYDFIITEGSYKFWAIFQVNQHSWDVWIVFYSMFFFAPLLNLTNTCFCFSCTDFISMYFFFHSSFIYFLLLLLCLRKEQKSLQIKVLFDFALYYSFLLLVWWFIRHLLQFIIRK